MADGHPSAVTDFRNKVCPQAEVEWHAITSTTLNDIVQSVVDEVSNYCHGTSGASGLPAIRKPFELNELRRQRRNDVAVSSLARIPDRFS
jgi:hypothetical protein